MCRSGTFSAKTSGSFTKVSRNHVSWMSHLSHLRLLETASGGKARLAHPSLHSDEYDLTTRHDLHHHSGLVQMAMAEYNSSRVRVFSETAPKRLQTDRWDEHFSGVTDDFKSMFESGDFTPTLTLLPLTGYRPAVFEAAMRNRVKAENIILALPTAFAAY